MTAYAANVEGKFGRFQIASNSIPFNQLPFETHYRAMFPDYTGLPDIPRWSAKTANATNHLRSASSSANDFQSSLNRNREGIETGLTEHRPNRGSVVHIGNVVANLVENANQKMVHKLEALKKSHAEIQTMNIDLLRKISTVARERDAAKIEMAKLRETHANEIRTLNALRERETVEAKARIQQLEKDKNSLRIKIQDTFDQKFVDLQSEKRRFTAELKKLQMDCDRKVKELEHKVKDAIEGKANVEKQFEQMVNRLEAEYESFCNSLLGDLL